MSLSKQTKSEKVAEREAAIVTAATAIFSKKGMQAAKMAEIARAADVAEGTLYLYFRNKEALFAKIVARHWESLTEGAAETIASEDDPWGQLRALAAYTLRRIVDDWKLFELSFVLHYADGEVTDNTDRQGYVRILDAIIQRGIDRGAFAPSVPARSLRDLFFGTLEYAARSALNRGRDGSEGTALDMLDQALRGVLLPERRQPGLPPPDRIEKAVDRLEKIVAEAEKLNSSSKG
jgi:TetR/AcrR family fatty acid metabolism transcriptional regulator